MSQNRRSFLTNSALSLGAFTLGAKVVNSNEPSSYKALDLLQPMTNDVVPITVAERKQRIAKAQQLMEQNKHH